MDAPLCRPRAITVERYAATVDKRLCKFIRSIGFLHYFVGNLRSLFSERQ